MDQKRVCLTVPAEPGFARIVRMTAASLAVTCDMGVDEVEDARMAAEEGFVYACATGQQECGIVFGISDEAVTWTSRLERTSARLMPTSPSSSWRRFSPPSATRAPSPKTGGP